MLSEQIKTYLSEVVGSATAIIEASPTARLSPMMLRALTPAELASAVGQGGIDTTQTAAIAQDPGAEAVRQLQGAILAGLADGRPVPPEDLADAVGQPVDRVVEHLRQAAKFLGVELDARGHVVGLGLSLVETRHQVYLGDHDQVLYAWCAPDALLLPGNVSQHSWVVAPCAATGQGVTIELGRDGVQDVRPSGAVLSLMAVIDPDNIRGSGCDRQNFFASPQAAGDWLDEHPGGFVLPVADAHALLMHLRDG
jgi:alkylmercury lyase